MLRSRQGVKWAAPSAIYKFMQPLPLLSELLPFLWFWSSWEVPSKQLLDHCCFGGVSSSLSSWSSPSRLYKYIIYILYIYINSIVRSGVIIIIIMRMASCLEIKTIIRVSLLWRSVWPSARPGAVRGKKILTPPLHHYCRASTWGQVEGCTSTFQVQDTW